MSLLRTLSHRGLAVRSLSRTMSAQANAPLLISPRDVQGKSSVVFLDSSWHMPGSPRNAREEYHKRHLPGARYLDLDEVASPHELGLKHMLPSGQVFAHAMRKLGISPSTHVVLYDSYGIFSAPRALYMLRAFGHSNSSVLNGGLPGWIADGLSVDHGVVSVKESEYEEARMEPDYVRDYDEIVANSKASPTADGSLELVLDARSRGRWLGTDPEPRPNMSSGHIPYSFSLPFGNFLQTVQDAKTGDKYTVFRSKEELDAELRDVLGKEFTNQALDGSRTVVTSCGSGMTAGVLWLGLKLLGVQKVGLYDESWTGYASRENSVIQKAA